MTDLRTEMDTLLDLGPMAPVANPYPLFKRIRDEVPVMTVKGAMGEEAQTIMLSRYDDVRAALKDDEAFSSGIVQRTMGIVMGPTMVGMNGPEHLKHRALVTPALAPRALRGDFPKLVDGIAHEIIDRFASDGHCDLSGQFTFSYPLTVFMQILGLPPEELDTIHAWGIDLTKVAHDPAKGLAASQKLLEYLMPLVEQRRVNPSSDLISTLANAELDGERLSDLEVVSFLRLLMLAGAETTYHLMGSALYALLKDPDLMQRVRNDRSLLEPLFHETLRWESPISTVVRDTTRDVEVAGTLIPKGSNVLCHIGSANRDERQFPEPDRFDIDRKENEHIAFGFGKHYCAGSRLALLEAEVGMNAVLDRLPNLREQPGEDYDVIGFSFRGPDRLPVLFDS